MHGSFKYVALAAMAAYLATLPISIAWNMIMLAFFTVELLWRNIRRLWDPRTWITVLTFYVMGSLAITFLVQIPLDLTLLALTGKTLTGWIPATGSWLSDHAVESLVTTFVFTVLLSKIITWFMAPAAKLKIFRRDVLEDINAYNSEYIREKAKKSAILFVVGLILLLLL